MTTNTNRNEITVNINDLKNGTASLGIGPVSYSGPMDLVIAGADMIRIPLTGAEDAQILTEVLTDLAAGGMLELLGEEEISNLAAGVARWTEEDLTKFVPWIKGVKRTIKEIGYAEAMEAIICICEMVNKLAMDRKVVLTTDPFDYLLN